MLQHRFTQLAIISVLAVGWPVWSGCSSHTDPPATAQRSVEVPDRPDAADLTMPSAGEPSQEMQSTPTVVEPEFVPASPPVAAETAPAEDINPLRQDESPATPPASDDKPTARRTNRPPTGKHSGVPFDPIKENGPIFVGWPKPKAALIITGMELGYLEPCGCAGLNRMKGGMGRRDDLFRQLREKGWPVVGLDVGGLVKGFGRQAELKYQTAAEAKRRSGYDVVAFGAAELRLPAGELLAVAAAVDDKPSQFVSANVGLLSKPGEVTPQMRVIDAAGLKIGVTSVLGRQYQREIQNDEVELSDPEAALREIVPALKRQSDYLVLLAHATREESVDLAHKFPEFNVVVSSDGYPEPPASPEKVPSSDTLLIFVGQKGMDAIVLGLYDDPAESVRYQRVPLDSRFSTTTEMVMLMTAYQEQLKALGFAGLGLRPTPHPLLESNGQFIGSAKCRACHPESYRVWKRSAHSTAYKSLEELNPPRNFDPECISCHVIGWHPTRYFPYQYGYESKDQTPELINTGCETCHGPGEKHAAAELTKDEQLKAQLRKAMIVTKAESKDHQCASCHDLDNSPDFDFDLYWPFVEHYEPKHMEQ